MAERGEIEKELRLAFNDKTIVITGGLGFIGSNLAHRLINYSPKKIIIIDALIEGQGSNISNILDIRDKLEIPFLEEGGININDPRVFDYLKDTDYIFNLAGSVSHIDSKNHPLEDLKVNLLSHVSFLETCKKYLKQSTKNFKILFTSTRDIYGKTNVNDLPIKEDYLIKESADPQGIHNYGAESHHIWYGKNFNFPVVSLRLTNTYGPRQKIDNPSQGFLGHFIYKSLKNQEIELWGKGENLRDFNYVEDVVDAMLLAMASNFQGIYNLGSFIKKEGKYQEMGNNICSVGDAAKRIINLTNLGYIREIPYPEDKKNIEPGHVYLDATKIYDDLRWYPKTNFENGILKTIDFYKNNPGYFNVKETKIPFLDLKKQHEFLKDELELVINNVIKNSNFVLGSNVASFEKEFSQYCNKQYGIGVGNGTDALKLALLSLNLPSKSEVIIPVNTAIPTAMAIKDAGFEIHFVDIDEDYLIDVNHIELAINEKTSAIMPVHLYGNACNMDAILKIANKHNLLVVEDCSQAHGATFNGRKVPIGPIGCFSFYPSKNLGCLGDGGMIITDSPALHEKLMLLRNYGQKDKYKTEILGVNSRLDELQAAILRVKLKHLDNFNAKRKELAILYNNLLKELVEKGFITTSNYNPNSVYHLYVIRAKDREGLMNYLQSKNITTLIHYPVPLHLQKPFFINDNFPIAENLSNEILSLPLFPELSNNQVTKICEEIKNYYGS